MSDLTLASSEKKGHGWFPDSLSSVFDGQDHDSHSTNFNLKTWVLHFRDDCQFDWKAYAGSGMFPLNPYLISNPLVKDHKDQREAGNSPSIT